MAISISRALFALLGLVAGASWSTAQTGTALIRRAPTLNGSVEGSIQVMTAESVTMNSSARVEGDLLMPGTPVIKLNGAPFYGGTREGSGDASPSGHKVTLNGGAVLRHVVRRTDPLVLPGVSGPPQPTGIRSVSLNQAGQSPGDFSTLKHLTLNSKVGNVAVPPGTYGNFNANSGSGFVFGEVGSDAPGVYHFQNLTLNSGSEFKVVGPVVVTVAGNFSTNANMGDPAHPAWLKLRIAGGGLTLASQRTVSADLEAPNGALTLNGGSVFIGAVVADRLIVNGNALLRVVALDPQANQPPVVGLTSPTGGTSFTVPAVLALEATATDPDGAVVRVEFYAGATKLGETTAIPAELAVTLTTPGRHVLTARAIDERGATGVSAPVEIRVLPPWPYYTGFEAEEDYELGPLDGQQGWLVRAGAAQVTAETAATGRASIALVPGDNASVVEQQLGAPDAPAATIFVDVSVRPAPGPTPGAGSLLQLDNASLAFVTDGNAGRIAAFHGDGQGGGSWLALPAAFVLEAGRASQWQRLTARLDYLAKTWDVYLNGRVLAYDLRFRSDTAAFGGRISIQGHPTVLSYSDDLYVGAENSIFQDADHDGMDDAWEAAHGLDPRVNDRSGDADGDGLSSISEFVAGTHPSRIDTDGDGIADGYELRHSLNPLLSDAGDDADFDGLTNLQEFELGTNSSSPDTDGDGLSDVLEVSYGFDPLRAQVETQLSFDGDGDGLTLEQELALGTDPTVKDDLRLGGDTDGDGLPDRWEIAHGSNPQVGEAVATLDADADGDGLSLAMEVQLNTDPTKADTDGDGMTDGFEHRHGLDPAADDADGDEDGDGVSNLVEYQQGSDPDDYYNGREPELLPFIGGEFDLGAGNVLAIRVTDKAGNPLVNAPVVFELSDDDPSVIALTAGGQPVGRTAEIRTGPGGIARIYLRTSP